MARIDNLSNFLSDVADAIKVKKDDQTDILASDFDTEILNLPTHDTADATAVANDVLLNKTAYGANGKLTGSMANNGTLNYTPSTSQQTIPSGYTSGGTISAIDITTLDEYKNSLLLSNAIIGTLPYIELEYIQSTGTQWIDTEQLTTEYTKVEITFQNDSTSINYARLFGCWGQANFEVVLNNTNLTSYYFVGKNDASVAYTLDASNSFQTFSMNVYREVIYNDTIIVPALTSATTDMEIELFRGSNRYSAYKLKNFKIYNGDTLIRDFIPVKRISDNKICLYDLVSNQFFTNQGTGDFIAGPEVK